MILGVPPNAFTTNPLPTAAESGTPILVEALLKLGASPNTGADTLGRTALSAACSRRPPDPELVKMLLLAGANPNTARHMCVPLHYAAQISPEIVKLLLDAGADPQPIGLPSPLDFAKREHQHAAAQLIEEAITNRSTRKR